MVFKRKKNSFIKHNNSGKSYFLLILSCFLFFNVFSAFINKKSSVPETKTSSRLLFKPLVKNQDPLSEVFDFDEVGLPRIAPDLLSLYQDDSIQVKDGKYNINLTIDKDLQGYALEILKKYKVPWGSIVALDPKTGKVLALASHSEVEPYQKPVALRSTFPAASLIKIVTSAAALEKSSLLPSSQIYYRGGDYLLNRSNFQPISSRDKRHMSFETALTKSCNPVFARIALNNLSIKTLEDYAYTFGFNQELPFDAELSQSSFSVTQDDYDFARTAAGFGDVKISPLHAAAMMASIANHGKMMRPFVVDKVSSSSGRLIFKSDSQVLRQTVLPETANSLIEMMSETVISGTARRQFSYARRGSLKNMKIAAKTGTLSGLDPKGRYLWFVATAPAENPQIAMAALVIDNGRAQINGSGLGSLFLERYAQIR